MPGVYNASMIFFDLHISFMVFCFLFLIDCICTSGSLLAHVLECCVLLMGDEAYLQVVDGIVFIYRT